MALGWKSFRGGVGPYPKEIYAINCETERVREYADGEEVVRMNDTNQIALGQMQRLFKRLKKMKKGRALELACGESHVTRHLLKVHFDIIDLMDQCDQALERAHDLKEECHQVDKIYPSSFEEFSTNKRYNCIVLRYSAGYLDCDALAMFLRKLSSMLEKNHENLTRSNPSKSFIIVQDNVQYEDRLGVFENDMLVRRMTTMERIFTRAGL